MPKTKREGPTRRDVQNLIRELMQLYQRWQTPAIVKAREEINAFRERLLDNPKLKAAQKRLDRMENNLRSNNEKGRENVLKVFRLFQAKGLTPQVCRLVGELAKKANAQK